jgi:uncharacterized protein (TIGR02001 family)
VLFEFDRADLDAAGRQVVTSAATQAKQGKETRLEVTGHADRAGEDGYNMDLSELRARAVKAELIAQGIPEGAIAIAWKGEREPLVPTPDGVAEPRNRRATIVISAALMDEAATSAITEEGGNGEDGSGLADQFSATFGFYTNYVFRGGSQTQNDPAFQGSFDWEHPTGFYAGVWASNIDFTDDPDDDANIEVDIYGGYGGSFDKFSYGVGFVYYAYPGANDAGAEYNYWEVMGSLGYDLDVVALTGEVYYSPEFFGETGDAIYYKAAVSVPLAFMPLESSLEGSVGYQTWTSDAVGFDDYVDWSIGLAVSVLGFDLGFTYTDTNIDFGGAAPAYTKELADAKFIFSISRAI